MFPSISHAVHVPPSRSPSPLPSGARQALYKATSGRNMELNQCVTELARQLETLAFLRRFGDGSHPTHRIGNQPELTCCADTDPARAAQASAVNKDTPLDAHMLQAVRNFLNDVCGNGKQPATPMTGVQKTIVAYANDILGRANDQFFPACHHDIHILVSESLAEIVGKQAAHPEWGDKNANVVKNILGALKKHFGDYLTRTNSVYRNFVSTVSPKTLNDYLNMVDADLAQMKAIAEQPSQSSGGKIVKPEQAYRAAAGLVLTTAKANFPHTVLRARRMDHHHHPSPYDETGWESHFAPFEWHAVMHARQNIDYTDMMPIPHRMTAPSFGGIQPEDLTDNVPPAYYADRGAVTEFWSKDRTALEAYNKLDPSHREMLNLCCTGTPVDASRIGEITEIAYAFARNVIAAQLDEGRTAIEVPFGEITGYKPAVPQEMLTGSGKAYTSDDKQKMQQKFIEGTTEVLCAIFAGADRAYAEALAQRQKEGKPIGEIEYMTRIVYHSDALPADAEVEHPNNRNEDSSYKEITTIRNMQDALHKVDKRLRESPADLPEGAQQPRHRVQWAHGGGTSVEPHNFMAGNRWTMLHALFRFARGYFSALELTSDLSWLTATARSINVSMASFLRESDDKNLQQLAELIECGDNVHNDAFMQLLAAERYLETHVAQGDHSDSRLLDLALVRAAVKKAARIYHTLIGAMNHLLSDQNTLNKLQKHAREGVYGPGDSKNAADAELNGLVKPGNVLGLFLRLADEWQDSRYKQRQPPIPMVWGTDNLTPAAQRSGVEKDLEYNSQGHGLLVTLAKVRPDLLDLYLNGPEQDQRFRGSRAAIGSTGIHDGPSPTRSTRAEPRPVNDRLSRVGAALNLIYPWRGKTSFLRPHEPDRSGPSSEDMTASGTPRDSSTPLLVPRPRSESRRSSQPRDDSRRRSESMASRSGSVLRDLLPTSIRAGTADFGLHEFAISESGRSESDQARDDANSTTGTMHTARTHLSSATGTTYSARSRILDQARFQEAGSGRESGVDSDGTSSTGSTRRSSEAGLGAAHTMQRMVPVFPRLPARRESDADFTAIAEVLAHPVPRDDMRASIIDPESRETPQRPARHHPVTASIAEVLTPSVPREAVFEPVPRPRSPARMEGR